MVDLETIIVLALVIYILVLDADELHPGNENVYNDYIDEC